MSGDARHCAQAAFLSACLQAVGRRMRPAQVQAVVREIGTQPGADRARALEAALNARGQPCSRAEADALDRACVRLWQAWDDPAPPSWAAPPHTMYGMVSVGHRGSGAAQASSPREAALQWRAWAERRTHHDPPDGEVVHLIARQEAPALRVLREMLSNRHMPGRDIQAVIDGVAAQLGGSGITDARVVGVWSFRAGRFRPLRLSRLNLAGPVPPPPAAVAPAPWPDLEELQYGLCSRYGVVVPLPLLASLTHRNAALYHLFGPENTVAWLDESLWHEACSEVVRALLGPGSGPGDGEDEQAWQDAAYAVLATVDPALTELWPDVRLSIE